MNAVYDAMERCLAPATPAAELIAGLQSADWQIRFAAAVALGDRREREAVGPLAAVLEQENAAALYTQQADLGGIPAGSPDGHAPVFPAGTTPAIVAAWARRGRLKQAACLALGEIGVATPAVLALLHRYAVDQGEDYAVRAAANKALGKLGQPASRPVLERSVDDPEWCTRTEAAKALARVNGTGG